MSDILSEREARFYYQKDLINRYRKTLIVVKANYPGIDKNTIYSTYIVMKAFILLNKMYNIEKYFVSSNSEGLIFYIIVDKDAYQVKKECIELEELLDVYRLLDIDVFNEDKCLSRSDLALSARKCFLCDDNAKVCNRTYKHSLLELQDYFNKLVISDIFDSNVYSNLVLFGLINELNKEYNYGCVGFNHSGIHKDMDYYTFIDSIVVLYDAFEDFKMINTSDFNVLRKYGKSLEVKMFKITKGVNTYKGAIFLLIILFAGIKESSAFNDITNVIKKLCNKIYLDYDDGNNDSFGKKLYHLNRIAGIRKIAFEGYKDIFDDYLLFYEKHNNINKLMLYIMTSLDDTTIIKRVGLNGLNNLRIKVQKVLSDKDYVSLDNYCMENNISCGGCADILAITIIVSLVKEYYYNLKKKP